MLQYPSILGVKKVPLGYPCVAFYKYDGSNLRFEWSPKKGWNKFGSRTQIIDIKHPVFGKGIELFQDVFAKEIIKRIEESNPKAFKNCQRVIAFAEFFGKNSFAGHHEDEDEKELKLFDIFLFQKGFISPKDFIKMFGDWEHCAKVVYEGSLDKNFIEKIRYNTLSEKLNEGVICKGFHDKIDFKTHNSIWMTKIKTFDFINRLKHRYKQDWEQYSE